ncbi:MAG: phosphatidate cytidylyltransferase [Deltaproteobacteria bacterium CG11_big_fil_rev_8_21_14_0_20_47_16]|nr:MAG: phosphatidate cytidylyltransferase [Deltaproteobacteria bacterium CG11_big_fil_rev_8_21_14_0_20_47_16]
MQRLITALFLIIAVGGVILVAPSLVFKILVLATTGRVLQELFRLFFPTARFYEWCAILVGMAVATTLIWKEWGIPTLPILIAAVFVIACIHMFHSEILEHVPQRVALTMFGILYIGCTLPYFAWLYALPHGKALVIMAIAMAAFGDTFAMFAGKTIGRHKMSPLLSPNKTWEGLAAGFCGSMFGALLVRQLMWPELALKPAIILALIIGIVGPIGDLIESMIKRANHVKDAGSLLPGHGGVLDRADALVFTAPTVYYFSTWFFNL